MSTSVHKSAQQALNTLFTQAQRTRVEKMLSFLFGKHLHEVTRTKLRPNPHTAVGNLRWCAVLI